MILSFVYSCFNLNVTTVDWEMISKPDPPSSITAIRKDIENMNLSGADLERSVRRHDAAGDKTLTNLSQSTLNFILDEQQNRAASPQAPQQPRPAAAPRNVTAAVAGGGEPVVPLITPAKPAPAKEPELGSAPKPVLPVSVATANLIAGEANKPVAPVAANDSGSTISSSSSGSRSKDDDADESNTSLSIIDLEVTSSEEGIYFVCLFLFRLICVFVLPFW